MLAYVAGQHLPLRDETGATVPGKPRLDHGMVPEGPVIAILWVLAHIPIPVLGMVLARDLAGVFAERLPTWIMVSAILFAWPGFEAAFRILWRAPRRSKGGPGDDDALQAPNAGGASDA